MGAGVCGITIFFLAEKVAPSPFNRQK